MKIQLLTKRHSLGCIVSLVAIASVMLAPAWKSQAGQPGPAAAAAGGPYFVENVGQFDPAARFLLLDGLGRTWLAEDALWISVLEAAGPAAEGDVERLRGVHLKLAFQAADGASLLPGERQGVHVSYFLGADPEGWQADVPVWGEVRYTDLYPGIDLVLGGEPARGTLPWRLEVGQGAELSAVRLQVWGAQGVTVRDGRLRLATAADSLDLPLLRVVGPDGEDLSWGDSWLPETSVEAEASGAFEVTSPFVLAQDAEGEALVAGVDDLAYSTFLGGSSWDWGFGIDVDDSGAAYVSGSTPSADFPTVAGSFDTTLDAQDVFAVKLNSEGSGLVYATFVGGSNYESGRGVAVAGGDAYLTGRTNSPDFPTTAGAFDTTCGTDGLCDLEHHDTFLIRLNSTGTALEYATFVGGEDNEVGVGVATEGGRAYVAGQTESTGFPTTPGAFDRTCGTDGKCNPSGIIRTTDAFLVKINPAGLGAADLEYGAYLGGSSDDDGSGVAVEGGIAYLTGQSHSYDFPASSYSGGGDAFVVKLDPAGGGSGDLVYGTFLGGSNYDSGEAVAVMGGLPSVAGETRSSNFPATWGSFGEGVNDAFVARLDASGALDFAAYLGGSGQDQARGLALNALGHAIVTGQSQSTDFPTTSDSYDPTHNGGKDVILARVDADAADPIAYATYLGGGGDEDGEAVAVDPWGSAYATGYTASSGYPSTPGSFQPAHGGGSSDAFVSKIRVGSGSALAVAKRTNGEAAEEPPGPYVLAGDPVAWTYAVTNTGNLTLTGVTVVDDQGVTVSCPGDTLAPDEAMTCTASGTAIAGQYANLGTASGTPPVGPNVTDSDPSHYYGAAPSIAMEKHTNGGDADEAPGPYVLAGDPVAWTYTVTNTGNLTLTGVTVVDDQGMVVSCPGDTLAPDEAMTCTAGGTADEGQYANEGTASGTPPGGLSDVTDSDASHYYGVLVALDLEKHTNGQDADLVPGPYVLPGDPVEWTYIVTNTGNVALNSVTVVDDNGTPGDPADDYSCHVGRLEPGEADSRCVQNGTAEEGPYGNVGTAEGTYGTWTATDSDPSHYLGVVPGLDLEKCTNGQDADMAPGPYLLVGETVTWTYVVANVGDQDVVDVLVLDDNGTPGDPADDYGCAIPSIPIAGVDDISCVQVGTVQAGQYANVASAEGQSGGYDVADLDPSHYFGAVPSIDLEKHTNGQDADGAPGPYVAVGDAVEWEYVVTNTGNVELTGVVVTDDLLGAVCTIGTLAPEATKTCTASGTAAAGQYVNVGMASGAPPGGLPDVTDADPSHHYGATPSIALKKHTNGQDADEPPGPYLSVGQPVTWTYVVANTGDVPLTELAVHDDRQGVVYCPAAELDSGETMICTAAATAQFGQYQNQGRVIARSGSTELSATDLSHYYGRYTIYMPSVRR